MACIPCTQRKQKYRKVFQGAVAGRLWPDRNPCPSPIICLTLHGSNLFRLHGYEAVSLAQANPPSGGFYRRLPIARCVSVCRKIRHPKPPPLLRGTEWVCLQSRQIFKLKKQWQRRVKDGHVVPIHASTTTISSSTRLKTKDLSPCCATSSLLILISLYMKGQVCYV